MQNHAALPSGQTAIAAALNALWDIVGDAPFGRNDPASLQRLIDRFLDRRPAASIGELEHRLLILAAALEAMGPWASDSQVLREAEHLSDRRN